MSDLSGGGVRADTTLLAPEQRTHCPHGHPYDEKNTRICHNAKGQPSRNCRACRKHEQGVLREADLERFLAYARVHQWMKSTHTRSGVCERCQKAAATEWSSVSGQYKRDRADWLELCKTCHRRLDRQPGRIGYWTFEVREDHQGKALNRPARGATHCWRGHPFDEQNTKVSMRNGRPFRRCQTCARERARRYAAARRESTTASGGTE